MIFRRYGTSYQSIVANFDSLALNEVAFRRDRKESIEVDEADAFDVLSTHELVAEAQGDVQDETEELMLQRLEAKLTEVHDGLGSSEILVVENEQGHDWPKTRQKTSNVVVEGENRLRFDYSIAPALRVTVRRRPA